MGRTEQNGQHGSLRIAGRYRLIEKLGSGGMSEVWRGYDETLGRPVAVKVLSPRLAGDQTFRDRLRQEALAAARLCHPHITGIFDFGEAILNDQIAVPYVVMELNDGESVSARLTRQGPMPWRQAVTTVAEVASALATAHARGVVHRDVTPANVMLTGTGAKVVDFGISAIVGQRDAAPDGSLLGTPAYLAPERLGGTQVSAATDVYALGLLLYRTLSGRLPWPAETTADALRAHLYADPEPLPTLPGLPQSVVDLCMRCLTKDPTERPRAAEVAQDLAATVGLQPVLPPTVRPHEPRTPARRTPPLPGSPSPKDPHTSTLPASAISSAAASPPSRAKRSPAESSPAEPVPAGLSPAGVSPAGSSSAEGALAGQSSVGVSLAGSPSAEGALAGQSSVGLSLANSSPAGPSSAGSPDPALPAPDLVEDEPPVRVTGGASLGRPAAGFWRGVLAYLRLPGARTQTRPAVRVLRLRAGLRLGSTLRLGGVRPLGGGMFAGGRLTQDVLAGLVRSNHRMQVVLVTLALMVVAGASWATTHDQPEVDQAQAAGTDAVIIGPRVVRCTVRYQLKRDSGSNYEAVLTVNTTDDWAAESWRVQFSYPGKQRLTGAPKAITQKGRRVTANGSGTLQAFTLRGEYRGHNALPLSFTLDGHKCQAEVLASVIVNRSDPAEVSEASTEKKPPARGQADSGTKRRPARAPHTPPKRLKPPSQDNPPSFTRRENGFSLAL
jgi:eukaryotic-like serine/threonine-protein kinase